VCNFLKKYSITGTNLKFHVCFRPPTGLRGHGRHDADASFHLSGSDLQSRARRHPGAAVRNPERWWVHQKLKSPSALLECEKCITYTPAHLSFAHPRSLARSRACIIHTSQWARQSNQPQFIQKRRDKRSFLPLERPRDCDTFNYIQPLSLLSSLHVSWLYQRHRRRAGKIRFGATDLVICTWEWNERETPTSIFSLSSAARLIPKWRFNSMPLDSERTQLTYLCSSWV